MSSKSPTEANVRRLVGILAEFFPNGSDSGDLLLKFRKIAHRSHATFYNCLASAKAKGWVVTDGKTYRLAADGSWRTPPIGNEVRPPLVYEPDQFQHVLEMKTEQISKLERSNKWLKVSRRAIGNSEAVDDPAIAALVTIMSDSTISTRKRVQAAEGLLSYKTPQDVANSAKLFLASIFTDPDANIDDKLVASTLLRRSEAPRVAPKTVQPTYGTDIDQGTDRREAWRAYELAERELRIIVTTKDVAPPGWDDDLRSNDYVPPEGWTADTTDSSEGPCGGSQGDCGA